MSVTMVTHPENVPLEPPDHYMALVFEVVVCSKLSQFE